MSTNETPFLWPQYQAGLHSVARGIAGWLRALNRATVQLIDNLAVRWERRSAVRGLGMLDDHMLHDIGISRGEIEYVARHGREEHRPNVVTTPRRAPLAAPDLKQAA